MILVAALMLILQGVQPVFADATPDVPGYDDLAAQAQEQAKQGGSEQQKLQKEYNAALGKLVDKVSESKTTLDSLVERPVLSTNYTTANFLHYLDREGLYSDNTRSYYTGENGYNERSLDEEFVESVSQFRNGYAADSSDVGINSLFEKLQAVKQKAHARGFDLALGNGSGRDLNAWLAEAGMVRVAGDSRTEFYPKKAWSKILDELDAGRSGRITNLHSIERLYGIIPSDSGVTKVDKIGRTVRFVKDGVTYTYNCNTHLLTRISGSEKIKETAAKSGGVFWNILKGTMMTLATGAEIYRPFLTAKTNERFLDGWENTALKSLDYGFPIPPYPVLQPIYPVNLTGIFKLWGMGEEQSSYDRSMAWFNQSPFMQSHMAMNPMAMNMAMQMQMRQRMMNPWGGGQGQGGPWGQQGQGGNGGVNVDWNQLLQPLQYQTFAMSNMMNRMSEEITIKRQQAENSINNLRALEAATGQYQRIIPELMGVLNKLGTAQGQLNNANNRTQNSMSDMNYSVQYKNNGGSLSGGFGGGSNPYAQQQGW